MEIISGVLGGIKMYLGLLEIGLYFSIVGAFFAIKAFLCFIRTDEDTMMARILLNKNFLHKNFIIIFILGGLISLHTFFEFLDYQSIPILYTLVQKFYIYIQILYLLTLTISTFLLAILAIYWHRLCFSLPKK